ncbi:N-myc-interactor [Aulostomus maculatus]
MDGGAKTDTQLEEARRSLDEWRTKLVKADDVKSRLTLETKEEEMAKNEAHQEVMALLKQREECQREFIEPLGPLQLATQELDQRKQDLLNSLKEHQAELEAKRVESSKLKQTFKISAQMPNAELKFAGKLTEESRGNSQEFIREVFSVNQKLALPLLGGQALITFEEEKVASEILRIKKWSVPCNSSSLNVTTKAIILDPVVKFEINLDISKKEIKVSKIPASFPEERMKDRLELSFCRPSRGGGEVERLEYNESTGTGHITFLNTGVAEKLAQEGSYCVDLDSQVKVQVEPVFKHRLSKFQTFRGTSKRTVLLKDIEDVEPDEEIQDNLEIHFQKSNNKGGEIQSIKYTSKRNALRAIFAEDPGNDGLV